MSLYPYQSLPISMSLYLSLPVCTRLNESLSTVFISLNQSPSLSTSLCLSQPVSARRNLNKPKQLKELK